MVIVFEIPKTDPADWIDLESKSCIFLQQHRHDSKSFRVLFKDRYGILCGHAKGDSFVLSRGAKQRNVESEFQLIHLNLIKKITDLRTKGMEIERNELESLVEGYKTLRDIQIKEEGVDDDDDDESDEDEEYLNMNDNDSFNIEDDIEGEKLEDDPTHNVESPRTPLREKMTTVEKIEALIMDAQEFRLEKKFIEKILTKNNISYELSVQVRKSVKKLTVLEERIKELIRSIKQSQKSLSDGLKKGFKDAKDNFEKEIKHARKLKSCKAMKVIIQQSKIKPKESNIEKRIRKSEMSTIKSIEDLDEDTISNEQIRSQALQSKKMVLKKSDAAIIDTEKSIQDELHDDLKNMEYDMDEVNDILHDIKIQAGADSDTIREIERRVQSSIENVEKGSKDFRDARAHQRLGTRRPGCVIS